MSEQQNFRLLHIIAGAQHGGAETFCLDAICALDDAGVKQHVICRPHERYIQTLQSRNIPFDTISFSRFDKLWRGPKLIRERIKSFQADLVHAWMRRAAGFVPTDTSVPVLGWFGGPYDLKRYRACDFYMGVTKNIIQSITEKGGEPERTFLVHTFGTLEDAPSVDRTALETPPDAQVVLLLSRMHTKKGIDTLLHAASKVPANVYFWLAGDGPELENYKNLSATLGLQDRVRFLGWRDDRAALLKSADVCVLPSRYEPFGTVMAEAWYSGVPLVAAKAAGPLAYVEDGENGLLCKIDDAGDLADKLTQALSDQILRAELIKNGHQTCEALFSRDGTVKALLSAYSKMLHTGKKGVYFPQSHERKYA